MLMNLFQSFSDTLFNQISSSSLGRRRSARSRFAAQLPAFNAGMESLESRTLLSAQMISSSVETIEVQPSETIVVPVFYSTVDDAGQPSAIPALALGFNIHYDSQALTFLGTRNVLADDLMSAPTDVAEGAHGATVDFNPDTDRAINTIFLDFTGTFPNQPAAEPVMLFEAVFRVSVDFHGTSEVNFTRNAGSINLADGSAFDFESQNVKVQVQPMKATTAASESLEPEVPSPEFNSNAEPALDLPVSQMQPRPGASVTSTQAVNATENNELPADLSVLKETEVDEATTAERSDLVSNRSIVDESTGSTDTLDSLFRTEFASGIETDTTSIRL